MNPSRKSFFLPLLYAFGVLLFLWGFMNAPAVHAATLTVDTLDDELNADGDCSLREAISAANTNTAVDACPAGDAGLDTISLPAGTIVLTAGQLTISQDVILQGAGSGSSVIDGNGADRVLELNSNSVVTITGVTLRNGNITGNGGGVYVNMATAVFTDTIISNNTATNGGGVYIFSGSATLLSGQIMTNTATTGGGVYVQRSTASFSLNGGTVGNNTAVNAGGVYVNQGSIVISGGEIRDNTATATTGFPGGGIYVATGSATLAGGVIRDNSAYRGAGILVNNGWAVLSSTQIVSNTATYGGGVYLVQGGAVLTQTGGLIAYNHATANTDFGGGGVYIFSGNLVMEGGEIRQNVADYDGGGVNVASGTAVIRGGSLLNNTAANSGGAVHIRNSTGVVTITNALLDGNTPDAVAVDDGTMTLAGNTIQNHITALRITNGMLTAYANNVLSYTTGIVTTGGVLNGRHNWWGSGATSSSVGQTDAFDYRLGALVVSWGAGTLPDGAAISGGTGTGVVVSHGTAVPFSQPASAVGTPCSDFYDFFTLPGASGTWTVEVPISSDTACDNTFTTNKLFGFALNGANAPDTACAPDAACWNLLSGVSGVAGSPRKLSVSLTTAQLGGTPIVAGNTDANDPTAISLRSVRISAQETAVWLWGLLLVLFGITGALWQRQNR
ncbi:MAG: CSLREA domain-containing protein [Chloroflexi bacterium]|nr:MAG: CSLREA domain-containing protein [Chloroflexota bacterium]